MSQVHAVLATVCFFLTLRAIEDDRRWSAAFCFGMCIFNGFISYAAA